MGLRGSLSLVDTAPLGGSATWQASFDSRKGYHYEGEFFWDYWLFNGDGKGSLKVGYGNDGGEGWDGDLESATVELVKI